MKTRTIQALRQLNRRFYAQQAAAFDRSRQAPWSGWERLVPQLRPLWAGPPPRVLDVGCGNGRLHPFLLRHLGRHGYVGVDECRELLAAARRRAPSADARYLCADAAGTLPLRGEFSLVAAFGLLHHVPSRAERARLLRRLAGRVAPGGFLALAFWRFLEEPRFARRVRPRARVEAALAPEDWEAGDVLLPFQDRAEAWRYCHDCDEAEQEALLADLPLALVDRYRADGKEGRLNQYVLLRRDGEP